MDKLTSSGSKIRLNVKYGLVIMALIFVLVLCISALISSRFGENTFSLRILHTNDMHARFDQTSARSTKCSPKNVEKGECYGGFARLATMIRDARKSDVSTLFLNAGDTYQGTAWFSVHRWKIVSKLLNMLKPDAISLGNHEFDDGLDGLIPFLKRTTYPVVAANLDFSKELRLEEKYLKKSIVINVKDRKIGVIGYLTEETKSVASTGNITFLDEVTEIQKEVRKLQAEGVTILIALGHSGFDIDKRIAQEVDGIDLVIGGHSHTFLHSDGKRPDIEIPDGHYPTEIKQKSGRTVYVVQAYAFTKYLGSLIIDFDNMGEVQRIEGKPVLMNNTIQQAKDILDELKIWQPALDVLENKIVGTSRGLLEGNRKICRKRECNLGNLVTDAMIDYNHRKFVGEGKLTDAAVAFITSGDIRTSIDKSPGENITMTDVVDALPFNNGMVKIDVPGKILLEVLEWSVNTLKENNDTADLKGAFLQYSGIQVTYDISEPSGSRVVSVMIRCSKCEVPSYLKIDVDKIYTVLTTDYIQGGGDGYYMLKNLKPTAADFTIHELFAAYLKDRTPIHPEVDWRIAFTSRRISELSKLEKLHGVNS